MGVDRKALCSSHESGIFISAGTAITVDIVEKGKYQGGFLLLGLKQYLEGYANISPALKTTLNRDINLEKLPKSTRDGISYGILAPIKCIVEKYRMDKRVYISGGDGRFLSSHFQNAIFDEKLIFLGIKRNLMGSNFSNYLLKIS
jgi:type III pantothenate kinase